MSSPSEFGRRGLAAATAAPAYGTPPKSTRPSAGPSAFAPFIHLFFSFEGRIRRRDYWLGHVSVTLLMFLGLWMEISVQDAARANLALLLPVALFSLALPIVFMWSALAVQVKRWHDRDKSWPWLFIGFIPFIGGLWLFVELGCLDGTPGDNRFGHSPKLGPAAVFD